MHWLYSEMLIALEACPILRFRSNARHTLGILNKLCVWALSNICTNDVCKVIFSFNLFTTQSFSSDVHMHCPGINLQFSANFLCLHCIANWAIFRIIIFCFPGTNKFDNLWMDYWYLVSSHFVTAIAKALITSFFSSECVVYYKIKIIKIPLFFLFSIKCHLKIISNVPENSLHRDYLRHPSVNSNNNNNTTETNQITVLITNEHSYDLYLFLQTETIRMTYSFNL